MNEKFCIRYHRSFRGFLAILTLFWLCESRADDPVEEAAIVTLATDHPSQGRSTIMVDAILTQAAQVKADDMLARDYFDHVDPDGCGPNFLIQSLGYALPAGYSTAKNGNNIESIYNEFGFGPADADRAWDAWLASPGHRQHVLAEIPFYAAQTHVGVGIASDGDNNYYVFLAAAPPGLGVGADKTKPTLTYDKPGLRARPRRTMRHKGTAVDSSGIESVRYRIKGKPWQAASYSDGTKQWTGKTKLDSRDWRKIRKGRKALVVEVTARDNAGNSIRTKRKFRR